MGLWGGAAQSKGQLRSHQSGGEKVDFSCLKPELLEFLREEAELLCLTATLVFQILYPGLPGENKVRNKPLSKHWGSKQDLPLLHLFPDSKDLKDAFKCPAYEQSLETGSFTPLLILEKVKLLISEEADYKLH